MNLRNYIATSDNLFANIIKFFFYKSDNKYYPVNNIIEKSEILPDGDIRVELKDGTVLLNPPSGEPADIQFTDRIKYGSPQKLNKVISVDKHYFVYEIISELFVNNIHFKYFRPAPGAVVVDAGANIGGFTIQAAKMVGPEGRVISIEPDSLNRKTLRKNIEANKLENVIIVEKGLWSKKDKLKFFSSHRPGEHSLIEDNAINKGIRKVTELEVDTLDNILEELGIEKAGYVKMDIEGAEAEAIKGCENLLKQDGVYWAVEADHEFNGKTAYAEVAEYFRDFNNFGQEGNFRGTIYAVKQ